MLWYRKVLTPDIKVSRVLCNKCGAKFSPTDNDRPDMTTIENLYGYASSKDGCKYVSHVCETCMDAFYATFVIPPQKMHSVILDEDPGMPIQYDQEQ